ncbi:MAG: triose-phosphate isomerase [Clostridia bacterium]|nr:triose-phosphate isomerase [Clostridia bacterium]
MRKKYIIGNWKMNKTNSEAKELIALFKEELSGSLNENIQVVVCPPYTSLDMANSLLDNTNIKLGAQNVHYAPNGAYTGEISISMLKDLGVEFCIVGHSERRAMFVETDKLVNLKVQEILKNKLKPVICVGETLEEREYGKYKEVVKTQIEQALKNIDSLCAQSCVIAYEPVWAIGTGKNATVEQAQEMCEFIRYVISQIYEIQVSQKVSILYGGSVNINNSKDIMSAPDIDGALIGGASLKSEFIDIVKTQI